MTLDQANTALAIARTPAERLAATEALIVAATVEAAHLREWYANLDGSGLTPWRVHPYRRGFVVLRRNVTIPGTFGVEEALTNDGSNEIAFDAGRLDCFFTSYTKACAAIANFKRAAKPV